MLNDDTKNMLDDFFDKEYASAKKFEQLALFKQSYKSAPALALMMLTHIDVDEHELLKVISNDLDTASQTYFFNYCVNSINASVGQVTLEHAINAIVTTAKYNEKSLAPELFDAIMAYSVLSEIKSGDE